MFLECFLSSKKKKNEREKKKHSKVEIYAQLYKLIKMSGRRHRYLSYLYLKREKNIKENVLDKIKCEAKKRNVELYRIYNYIYDHSPIQNGNKTINDTMY